MIPSVPEPEWYSDYQRARAMFHPIGPRIEIARDADWSIEVSRAQDGFCISHTRGNGGSGFTKGRLPSSDSRSKHVVAIIGAPAMRKGGVGFVTGLVTPNVARVEVQFRDGTCISAPTEAAPDALEADLRTFVIRTPADEQPFGPGYPPWTREYVLFASDDAVLERLGFSHRTRPT
jgi:hypothetical protein